MFTILGAGGVIGDELARELDKVGKSVRLVARNPKQITANQEFLRLYFISRNDIS